MNWAEVTNSFASDFLKQNGIIKYNHLVTNIIQQQEEEENIIKIEFQNQPSMYVKNLITCGGLYADRLAVMTGCSSSPKIIPFRGEYLLLKKEKHYLVKGNIYPVPNPLFPFLGVHFTPTINGDIIIGPNAVLAFSREGYKYSDINIFDVIEEFTYSGFLKFLFKHLDSGIDEIYHSLYMKAQIRKLQKYIPTLEFDDVIRRPSGVRAQALDENGNMVDDFLFETNKFGNILHVRNAPSPGATSSLAIAKRVVDELKLQ